MQRSGATVNERRWLSPTATRSGLSRVDGGQLAGRRPITVVMQE
jgi:hypothetical protein